MQNAKSLKPCKIKGFSALFLCFSKNYSSTLRKIIIFKKGIAQEKSCVYNLHYILIQLDVGLQHSKSTGHHQPGEDSHSKSIFLQEEVYVAYMSLSWDSLPVGL